MAFEHSIRDYLAKNLDCLETGLSLVQKEYSLPNPIGASGRVDILARDKYGLYVLIEIKRSDQAARQALHELHKYVALLQANSGISASEIRCLIISTKWHELLIPFSEYLYSSSHSVEGFEIKVDEVGKVIGSKKIVPVKHNTEIKLCPDHIIFLFDNPHSIYKAVNLCCKGLTCLGVKNYYVLEITYKGINTSIIYPYGLYVVIAEFSEREKNTHIAEQNIDLSEFSPSESPYYIEETVLSELSSFIDLPYSCEIGYPEKFTSILEDWQVEKIHRSGRLKSSKKLIDNNELLQQIAGFNGQNAFYYQGFSTPRHERHWEATLKKAEYTLIGNEEWAKITIWISQLVKSLPIEPDVSFQFFNPTNIIGSLYKFFKTNQSSYLPHFEIIVVSEDKEQTYIISGFISWNGCPVNQTVETILKNFYGVDPFIFFLEMNQGAIYEHDKSIMECIGLKYNQLLFDFSGTNTPEINSIFIKGEDVEITPISKISYKTISEYISENYEFISSISVFFEENSVGA